MRQHGNEHWWLSEWPQHGMLVTVIAFCLLPAVLGAAGIDLAWLASPIQAGLIWCGACVALFTLLLAGLRHGVRQEPTVPTIALALAAAGVLDALHLLLGETVGPGAWQTTRLFKAAALVVVGLYVARPGGPRRLSRAALAIGVTLGAVLLLGRAGLWGRLDGTSGLIARPLALLPLVGFAVAGLWLLPRAYREARSPFLYALIVSLLPDASAQVHMALGGPDASGSAAAGALLQLLAYLVPLAGLALDYAQVGWREVRASALMRAITESTPDAIFTLDDRGTILTVNRMAGRVFGCQPRALVGRAIGQLVRGLGPDPSGLYEGRRRGSSAAIELVAVRDDGTTFPVETAMDRVRVGGGLNVYFLRDISERRENEQIKHDFIATVSHELRTPLTSISGSLGLIAGGALGDVPPKVASLIAIAHRNSERLIRLINGILDIERIESGKLSFRSRVQQLEPVIGQAVDANRAFAARYEVGLVRGGPPIEAQVLIDADRVIQVVTNLLSNAVKLSPRGASVEIGTVVVDGGQAVRVWIRDQGPGVPAELGPRIFEKFTQAASSGDRSGGGTGLGLSIAKALIEQLDGRIGFDSDEGHGATFWFELPTFMSTPRTSRDDRPRLMACLSDRDVAARLRPPLEDAGWAVDLAWGLDACRRLLEDRAHAAVLLDLGLGGGAAIGLLRWLRQHPGLEQLPVFAVAPHPGAAPAGRLLRLVDWLARPLEVDRVIPALRGLGSPSGRPRVVMVSGHQETQQLLSVMLDPLAELSVVPSLEAARPQLEDADLLVVDPGAEAERMGALPAALPAGLPVIALCDPDGWDAARAALAEGLGGAGAPPLLERLLRALEPLSAAAEAARP